MKAVTAGRVFRVTIENEDVREFAANWPACNLDAEAEYAFEFDLITGDLVDIEKFVNERLAYIPDDEDGTALLALSDHALHHGARQLGLTSVLDIRFSEASAPRG